MSQAASSRFSIRPATVDDCREIAALIRELAAYEQLEHEVRATPDALRESLFGPRPHAEVLIAEIEGRAVGFALFFTTFSTFRGQPGLYLEDLFVRPEHRGRGIGKSLIASLAALAVERGCGRVEWVVLNWNESAIGFYRSLGALPMDQWTVYRVADEPMTRLAALAPALSRTAGS